MSHAGSCHCGRVQFTVEGDPEQVIECNCSHCARKGYRLWFVSREQLQLATPEADLATYTFNKHAIKHHFCPVCGCAPFGFGADKDGNVMAAVNVRCLPELDTSALPVQQVDGRSL